MKVYKAHLTHQFGVEGAGLFVLTGQLSPCGEWVERDDTRWRRSSDWKDTIEEARAVLAPKITELATAMLRQATALQAAAVARAVEV